MAGFCEMCGNVSTTEFCYSCQEIIMISQQQQTINEERRLWEQQQQEAINEERRLWKQQQQETINEERRLREEQQREYFQSLCIDKRKKEGIERCSICTSDFRPTNGEDTCNECFKIILNTQSREEEEEEEELPVDRRKRAEMFASRFDALFSKKVSYKLR